MSFWQHEHVWWMVRLVLTAMSLLGYSPYSDFCKMSSIMYTTELYQHVFSSITTVQDLMKVNNIRTSLNLMVTFLFCIIYPKVAQNLFFLSGKNNWKILACNGSEVLPGQNYHFQNRQSFIIWLSFFNASNNVIYNEVS